MTTAAPEMVVEPVVVVRVVPSVVTTSVRAEVVIAVVIAPAPPAAPEPDAPDAVPVAVPVAVAVRAPEESWVAPLASASGIRRSDDMLCQSRLCSDSLSQYWVPKETTSAASEAEQDSLEQSRMP
jgi:hypothetical protein